MELKKVIGFASIAPRHLRSARQLLRVIGAKRVNCYASLALRASIAPRHWRYARQLLRVNDSGANDTEGK